jgi:hypothetical protein
MRTAFLLFGLACSTAQINGCTDDEGAAKTPPRAAPMQARSTEPTAAATALVKEIATPEVHRAICSHVLPEIGHCGNYVEIDGQWVEVLWPALGAMEWCRQGKTGAEVEITGAMKDGRFVATALKTLPAKK